MIRDTVSVDEAVALLNEALAKDPAAMTALVLNRVPCNQQLADHPTIQVQKIGDRPAVVGLLGILNGLFGVDECGWGPIQVGLDHGVVTEFRRAK